ETDAHAAAVELVDLAFERAHEQLHQRADLILRPPPVLAGKREQGQDLDALGQAEVDADVDRAGPGAVADHTRPTPALRPPPVAIHDDGQVARDSRGGTGFGRHGLGGRKCRRCHQTAINSCSLALTTSSTFLMPSSVSFWISVSLRAASSSEMSFSLSSSLTWWFASRRMLRIATLAFSPSPCTCLDSSLRRSSVRAGRLIRITVPAVFGVRPRSELMVAFSAAETICFSHGVMVSERASVTATLATGVSGMSDP